MLALGPRPFFLSRTPRSRPRRGSGRASGGRAKTHPGVLARSRRFFRRKHRQGRQGVRAGTSRLPRLAARDRGGNFSLRQTGPGPRLRKHRLAPDRAGLFRRRRFRTRRRFDSATFRAWDGHRENSEIAPRPFGRGESGPGDSAAGLAPAENVHQDPSADAVGFGPAGLVRAVQGFARDAGSAVADGAGAGRSGRGGRGNFGRGQSG